MEHCVRTGRGRRWLVFDLRLYAPRGKWNWVLTWLDFTVESLFEEGDHVHFELFAVLNYLGVDYLSLERSIESPLRYSAAAYL